ncbi:MAG: DUF47 domain-containing protein [Halobacteriales archaeon]
MARTETPETVDELVARSGEYLKQVETATGKLEQLLSQYRDDQAAFESTLVDLRALESECDARVGDLRSLVGSSMDPNFTGLYLMSDALVEFYETADAVVNNAEGFGNELAAMRPDLSTALADDLREMAGFAHEAAVHLSRAGTTQFENLTSAGQSVDVSREAEQIRAIEGRCDDAKRRALDRAFTSMEPADALTVRALTGGLDDVTNAVEDAADRLVYMSHKGR